jgi:hypothetical protein
MNRTVFLWFFSVAISAAAMAHGQSLQIDPEHQQHRLILAKYDAPASEDVIHELTWILPRGVDSHEAGHSLVMVAPPRAEPYEIMLIAHVKQYGYLPGPDGEPRRFVEESRVRVFQDRFTVKGTTPPTPPNPDRPDPPPPDPDGPTPPPGKDEGAYELIRRSYDWALSVPQPFRSQAIAGIVKNYRDAAASSSAPGIVLEQLKQANRAVLPLGSPEREAWMAFFEPWSAYMAEMLQDGRLPNLTSTHQKAFDETREGLERAAKVQEATE